MGETYIRERIINAFEPVTELMSGLSYPVAFIMLSVGMLVIMSGNKHKGTEICKYAGIGYLAMQFLPQIMKILADVGQAMKSGMVI